MDEKKVLNTILDIIRHYDATAAFSEPTLEKIRECVILGIQIHEGPSIETRLDELENNNEALRKSIDRVGAFVDTGLTNSNKRLEVLENVSCAAAGAIGNYSAENASAKDRLDKLEGYKEKADLTTKVHKSRLSIHGNIMDELHTLIRQSCGNLMDRVDQLEANNVEPVIEMVNAIPDDAPKCFSCGDMNCNECAAYKNCKPLTCTDCEYIEVCPQQHDFED